MRKILLLAALTGTSAFAQSQDGLGIAQFNNDGKLIHPDNIDRWIVMGASLGGDYAEEAFTAENPGTIGVVQMEPAAYDFFLTNGRYADGTMFYLTFYSSEIKSEPQLQGFVQGFVQGDVVGREIHLIDKSRYRDGRAFFMFNLAKQQTSTELPPGNDCVVCHSKHGQFEGTFTQFYPAMRAHVAE